MSERHYVSKRADQIWQRMRSQYVNKLADHPDPPEDFCRLIDRAQPVVLRRVLGQLPYKHPSWPPTFGEFAALFAEADPEAAANPQSIDWQRILGEQTARIVNAHWCDWSPMQRLRFEYVTKGDAATGTGFAFVALRVPADPAANKPSRTYQFEDAT